MWNKIKSFFCNHIGRPNLEKHDKILLEMDEANKLAKVTIEEHIRLRGFPYSRSLQRARGQSI